MNDKQFGGTNEEWYEEMRDEERKRCPICGSAEWYSEGEWDQKTCDKIDEWMMCRDCGYCQ